MLICKPMTRSRKTMHMTSCDPDYYIICGPDVGSSECAPEVNPCGPDYDTSCLPECGPEEGY